MCGNHKVYRDGCLPGEVAGVQAVEERAGGGGGRVQEQENLGYMLLAAQHRILWWPHFQNWYWMCDVCVCDAVWVHLHMLGQERPRSWGTGQSTWKTCKLA